MQTLHISILPDKVCEEQADINPDALPLGSERESICTLARQPDDADMWLGQ
jgi:hypothetical protein